MIFILIFLAACIKNLTMMAFALELCPFATKNEAYLFVDKLHDISKRKLNENFFECVRKKEEKWKE